MIDPFRRGIAWYKYRRLEDDFINATLFFPLEKRYKEMWSEHFSDLIVRVGNSVDSLFRTMLKDKLFDSYPHVPMLRSSRRSHGISYFRDFFEPIYQLSSVEVQIAHGLTFYERKSCPFKEFKYDKIPDWWTSYNHVKHEWFDCIKEATLENTVRALAGLFVLNIIHKDSQKYLIQHTEVIDFGFRMSKREMEKYLMKSMIGVPKGFSGWKIKAETPLFTHFFRVDESVD